jgi:hypothetical protein
VLELARDAEDKAHRTADNDPDNLEAQFKAQNLTLLLDAFLL